MMTLLLQLEEASCIQNKTNEGILKDLVTSASFQVEKKFGDVVKAPNHVRLIVTSNETWVVPAGKEERRFRVLDVSDNKIQNTEYFKDLVNEMENGGFSALLDFLLKYDYSQVDLRIIPKTKALEEQKFFSLSNIEKCWYERLVEGSTYPGEGTWKTTISCLSLRAIFAQEAQLAGVSARSWDTVFGTALRKICPGAQKKKVQMNGEVKSFYILPELSQARAGFTAETGLTFVVG